MPNCIVACGRVSTPAPTIVFSRLAKARRVLRCHTDRKRRSSSERVNSEALPSTSKEDGSIAAFRAGETVCISVSWARPPLSWAV
eukprot:scaffold9180_cov35-Tisochrysis_lutea.AAC.2